MAQRRGHISGFLADKTRTRSTRDLIKIMWDYLIPFKSTLGLVIIVILIYTFASTYQPIIIQNALDLIISNPKSNLLETLIILFFIMSITIWIFQSINTWLMADVTTKMVNQIRKDAFNKLVNADMAYHHQNQSGNVTSRVVSDTNDISNGLQVFTQSLSRFLLVIATFSVLLSLNPLFALISLIAIPVALGITHVFATVGKTRMLKSRQAYGHVSGKLAENLAGVEIAKAFNQEERVSNEIKILNDESYLYLKQLISVFILVFPTISLVSTLLVFGILMIGGFLTTQITISVGDIFLATIMVQRFLRPIIDLSNQYTQLEASLAALDRVRDIIEAEPAIKNDIDAKDLILDQGKVKFSDVNFEYIENNPILKNINFDIPAGKKVALVGHTGAGKTTITALLLRFYDPIEGKIEIDNQNIKHVTIESLNTAISLVSQEPYLFADTVLENIRYGNLNATDKEIYELSALIGADQFIEALPDSYNTILQESGKSLSAGQRQMITIARTMLSNPKILVLDEATSRLDAYSESLVQNAQNILFSGRTTLIIAHRLSTIRNVDKIIVIDHGEIIESGTHEELMKNKNMYYELYNTYYAHQGVKSIEIEEEQIFERGIDTVVIKKENMNIENLIKSQITRYRQIGYHINFSSKGNFADIETNGKTHEIENIVDEMIHSMIEISQKSNADLDIEVELDRNNNCWTLSVLNRKVVLNGDFEHLEESSLEKPKPQNNTLEDLIRKVNGSFEVKSLHYDNKGIEFITRFF